MRAGFLTLVLVSIGVSLPSSATWTGRSQPAARWTSLGRGIRRGPVACAAGTQQTRSRLLEPYGAEPALPDLTEDEIVRINAGERVERVIMPKGTTGSGISVQDVSAPADVVFEQIADFPMYKARIKTVRHVEMFADEGPSASALIEVSRFRLQLFVDFVRHMKERCVAWTLNDDRPTTFINECVGYWLVEELSVEPPRSRVWFVVRVRLWNFVPRVIEGLVARVGLRRATTWIEGIAQQADG